VRKIKLTVAATLAGAVAQGAVTLFDFETLAEIKAAPQGADASRSFAVESAYATSGSNALHWTCAPWRKGLNEWPSFTLTAPVSDWSKYDRMVVDLVNLGDGGDPFSTFIAEKEGRIQNGLHATTRLPSHGYLQWIVPLRNWPETAHAEHVARVHFFTDRAQNFNVYLDRVTLLAKGEKPPAPSGIGVGRDLLPLMSARVAAAELECAEARDGRVHLESYWRFREACARTGQDTSKMLVGTASTMAKVRPRAAFEAAPAQAVVIRLARHEKEGVQVIVAPGDADLLAVTVTSSDLVAQDGSRFAASNVKCAVTGYVNITNPPPYPVGYMAPTNAPAGYCRKLKKPEQGWWPDPILDHMGSADVRDRDAQSFWVRVTCPEGQRAGLYEGTLTVSATNAPPVRLPFRVRVNAFAVPQKSPLPLAITFWPEVNVSQDAAWAEETAELRKMADFPVNAWKPNRLAWGDFLADYYITMDSLYGSDRQQWDVLARLKEQGRLGPFNLGYWSYFGNGPDAEERWRQATLPALKANYEKARSLGILDHAYLYGCDEIAKEYFPNIRKAVETLKREFPGVPIFTTAYDHEFGVGTELGCMDWFTPLTPRYDCEKAAAARKEGRQVWWYICCGPQSPYANMFVENAAIEGRLLMGAQTARMRPDGFLYYEISIWNMRRPLSGGPFTDWNPRSWTSYHGDGSWTCMGPGGMPLATQRLENFRDGLEDYAYALELERKLAASRHPAGDWAKQARELLAVPQDVMASMTDYTDDPVAVLRWRDAMADMIESAE